MTLLCDFVVTCYPVGKKHTMICLIILHQIRRGLDIMGSMTIDELDRLVTDSVHSALTFGNSMDFCGNNNHDVELNVEVVSGRGGGEERKRRCERGRKEGGKKEERRKESLGCVLNS